MLERGATRSNNATVPGNELQGVLGDLPVLTAPQATLVGIHLDENAGGRVGAIDLDPCSFRQGQTAPGQLDAMPLADGSEDERFPDRLTPSGPCRTTARA